MLSLLRCAAAFSFACLMLGAIPAIGAQAQIAIPAAPTALTAAEWRERTRIDLAAFAEALRQNYIYAVYPDPAGWEAWFAPVLAKVEGELALVQDEAGHQAVLRHLASAMQDAHVYIRFNRSTAVPLRWPGFLVRYDGDAYRVAASRQAGIADGAEVSTCDGKPMPWWISAVARLELGLPDTLEVARNDAAVRLFMDRATPLRPRPALCVISDRTITLDWVPTSTAEINPLAGPLRGFGTDTAEVSTRLIGDDVAWVRLGYFYPSGAAQAAAFHAAIAAAPSLRDKHLIVLDVRGNHGGSYNWFMAYLRGLYGQAYADHHATARLRIQAAYRVSPAYVQLDQKDDAMSSDLQEPADPPYEIYDDLTERLEEEAVAAGASFFRATALPLPPTAPVPSNPVRGQVYVLTDHGCGSACISFVDELKLFPGVKQIGLSTTVDSRSGTAVDIPLPGGTATAAIAAMTRDGRVRGDNEPHLPSIRFTGDIQDDAAVEAWVLRDVAGR